jgi:hypothetical protein
MPKVIQFQVLDENRKDKMVVYKLLALMDDGRLYIGNSDAVHVPTELGGFNEVTVGKILTAPK